MALIRIDAPRGTFAHKQLALAACQINFEPILRLGEASAVASFQDAFREEYPTLARVAALQINLGASGFRAATGQGDSWAFASADQRWQMVLGRGSLTIQSRNCSSYEELRDRFLTALRSFVDLYEPGARLRLGLRYINQIVFDDVKTIEGWRKLVRPELLGLAAAEGLIESDELKSSFGQARFASDESQMLVRYGYVEPGLLTHPMVPPQQRPHLLLDMDEFDVRRVEKIDPEQARRELDEYHEDVYRLFRWAFTDAGIKRLETREELEANMVPGGSS